MAGNQPVGKTKRSRILSVAGDVFWFALVGVIGVLAGLRLGAEDSASRAFAQIHLATGQTKTGMYLAVQACVYEMQGLDDWKLPSVGADWPK